MKYLNFDEPKHVHFIGIGGISMSGLAHVLKHHGFTISGSDQRTSDITKDLEKQGMTIMAGHAAKHIQENIDLVVYTAAIAMDNPEYLQALELSIPTIDRATLLGEIMSNYAHSIGVSGTHGKTTTTSMLANILLASHLDPTISVGGLLDAIDGNIRIGADDTFLAEACEYTNSFLKLNPYIGSILNIEEDHMDFFEDLEDIRNSFKEYVTRIKEEGYLVINNNIPNVEDIYKDAKCKVITFGINDPTATIYATNIVYHQHILPEFDLMEGDTCLGKIKLNVPGLLNIENAVCALATAKCLNISFENLAEGLYNFKGTKRRFEIKGTMGDMTIIDDYAHHPTAIEKTLKVIKDYPHNELWCVFQPHTYTRTKAFLKEFAEALSHADHVILADIYAAREIDPGDIHSIDLWTLCKEKGTDAVYLPSFGEIEKYIRKNSSPGDLLITMGAGDIYSVGEHLVDQSYPHYPQSY